MLAHFDPEKVDRIVADWGLPEFTDETITDWESLAAELEEIREVGIAYNRGEYLPGIVAVAAPIRDNDGTVHGAVTLAGPQHRLESEWDREELHDQLRSTANTIEVNLLYTD